jgi:uncharacterized membrane protein
LNQPRERCLARLHWLPVTGNRQPIRDIVRRVTSTETSSTGLPPHAAAALSYLAWWLSGVLFFVVERESRFVKFHAAQAMVGLGTLWALGLTFWVFGLAALFVSVLVFKVLLYVAYAVWCLGLVAWAVCIIRAWQGEAFELPWAGGVARRLSEK